MYTQCPECSTAFRVTAEVLRQAAGRVRCGGCGYAFNALDYLSEQKPAAPPVPPPDDDQVESAPEPPRLEADEPPESISAERSAALLKTLDELAGPDIRIEDTGIEWRVLHTDEDEDTAPAEEDDDAGEVTDDAGSIRWFIDESPTPVDEQLSDEPGDIDAAEIFEPGNTSNSAAEMRFDDDTPLPDDFDFDSARPEPASAPAAAVRDEPAQADIAEIDLALGEPEDWEDLLGEVDAAEEEHLAEIEATVREFHEEDAARDEEPLPDVDTQFATQALAMGIDLSGMQARAEQAAEDGGERAAESEAGEDATIDDDLVAAAFEAEARSREEDAGRDESDVEGGEPDESIIGAGQTGHESEERDATRGDDELWDEADSHDATRGDDELRDESDAYDEPSAAAATRDDNEGHDATCGDGKVEDDGEDYDEFSSFNVEEPQDLIEARDRELVGSTEDDGEDSDEFSDFDVEEPQDLIEARDRELVGSTEDDARLAAELGLHAEDESEDDRPEQVVPPLTEEEQTINMMIDQDLLAIAVEDEDGFASTIIQKQRSGRDESLKSRDEKEAAMEAPDSGDEEDELLVETIIMEGEFVRDAVEEERLEEERRKAAAAKTEAGSETGSEESAREEQPAAKEPVNYRMVAGIAALALLFGVQYVHHSRESLAVYPAFNNSVGPIYRMLGMPVTPAWDIAGWRFEATKGSTDESDEVLTIYSRIGNKSGEALPYPLINVSLTDRFEDIIGSKVLEPGEYLAENLDTRESVAPGETFSAVISIDAPDANATGFKLNVCYRQPGGRLRCAIDDFR